MFYRACPDCGANLDPGEMCTCREEKLHAQEEKSKKTRQFAMNFIEEKNGQLRIAV